MIRTIIVISLALAIQSCSSSSDNALTDGTIDLAQISNGAETGSEYWDCSFDDVSTPEIETDVTNTITFWSNARGITGSGLLYDWVIVDGNRVDGTYDGGGRTFSLEMIKFSDGVSSFMALNTSTRQVGTPEENVSVFNASCERMAG